MKNILLGLGLLTLVACQNDPRTTDDNAGDTTNRGTNPPDKEVYEQGAAIDSTHTAMNSLDVVGTYKGVLPCADCAGIATTLRINADTTYEMMVEYLGKKEKLGSASKGKYKWSDGRVLVLEGINNARSQYLVGENNITQLDVEGKKIGGANASKYVLAKQ